MRIHPRWARAAVVAGFWAAGCTSTGFHSWTGAADDGAQSELEAKLASVVFPVLAAATEWCPQNQELTYGFLLRTGDGKVMSSEGNRIPRVAVTYVHPGFPAAEAGLRAGAGITAVNGVATTGMDGDQVMQLLRKAARARVQPLTLSIEDAGRVSELNFDGVWACRFSVHIIVSDHINAYADGTRILLTTGILRFVASDDELAFVLAHEIAHNALEHSQAGRLKSALDGFLAATTGEPNPGTPPPVRRSLEAQADYVGMHIVARAGFDVRAAGDFWRRLIRVSATGPGAQFILTHPDTPDRLMAFERTVLEIEKKGSRGRFAPGRFGRPATTPASPALSPD